MSSIASRNIRRSMHTTLAYLFANVLRYCASFVRRSNKIFHKYDIETKIPRTMDYLRHTEHRKSRREKLGTKRTRTSNVNTT
jgi:hypothetical protein